MKTIKQFILESDKNWIDDNIKKLSETNTEGKVKTITLLWKIYIDYNRGIEVRNGHGKLWDRENMEQWKGHAWLESALSVTVYTSDKGNFYGLERENVNGRPKIAELFNKRVKGTKGFVWTRSIEHVKQYLDEISVWYKKINVMPGKEEYWGNYGYFTTYDIAKEAASILTKIHHLKVRTDWHNEKIKEIQEDIKWRKEAIERAKQTISQLEAEIADLQDDITEYETLKNVSSEDFNESLSE